MDKWILNAVCCLSLTLWVSSIGAATLLIDDHAALAAPRFAEGDVDGDGVNELVAGGRVGRFRAVTTRLRCGRHTSKSTAAITL